MGDPTLPALRGFINFSIIYQFQHNIRLKLTLNMVAGANEEGKRIAHKINYLFITTRYNVYTFIHKQPDLK